MKAQNQKSKKVTLSLLLRNSEKFPQLIRFVNVTFFILLFARITKYINIFSNIQDDFFLTQYSITQIYKTCLLIDGHGSHHTSQCRQSRHLHSLIKLTVTHDSYRGKPLYVCLHEMSKISGIK